MTTITLNNLPEAVQRLLDKVDSLERTIASGAAPAMPDPDFINATQAAEYLGKATQTIYGLVNRNAIPHFGKGKHLRFSKSDLKYWLINSKS